METFGKKINAFFSKNVPKVIGVDGESVRMFFPRDKQYLTFEVTFPTVESYNAFLESDRSRRSLRESGGVVVLLQPYRLAPVGPILEEDTSSINAGDSLEDDVETIAATVDVNSDDLETAYTLAERAFLNSHHNHV